MADREGAPGLVLAVAAWLVLRDEHGAVPGAVAEGGLAGATVARIILPLGLVDEAGEEVAGSPVQPGWNQIH